MARRTGAAPLSVLLNTGKLEIGEMLIIRRRSAAPIEGQLEKGGLIRVDGQLFSNPTTAAKAARGSTAPVNGWDKWRVPRLHNRTLTQIRDNK